MKRRKRLLRNEVAITIAGLLAILMATVSGPRLHQGTTTDALVQASVLKSERIEVLEALLLTTNRNNNGLRAQLAENNLLRNKAYGQLDVLIRERDAALEQCVQLAAQVEAAKEEARLQLAQADGRIMELSNNVELVKAKSDQARELESRFALASERDAAVDRAKKAEDRIRELTLELHRSGSWP